MSSSPAESRRASPAIENETAPPTARRRRRYLLLARYGVAALLLFYLFQRVSLADVARVAEGVSLGTLAVAIGIVFLSQALLALRLAALARTQGLDLSTARVLDINIGAYFYALFVPGGNITAGTIRILKLAHPGHRYAAAVSAIVSDRVHATISLFGVGAVFWLVDWPPGQQLAGALLIGGCAASIAALPLLSAGIRWLSRTEQQDGRLRRLVERLRKLAVALDQYRLAGLRPWLNATALSLLAHLISTVGFYLIAVGLGVDVSLVAMAWIRAFVLVLTMLPISVAGLGVREAAFLFVLAPYGVPESTILAFSLAIFAAFTLVPGLVGAGLETTHLLRSSAFRGSARQQAAGPVSAARTDSEA